ncbi:retrovirus-related pol polyprotein from transposon 17.6 [Tanacetum coccineum]
MDDNTTNIPKGLNSFANLRDIDGRILGKDGKPLKPILKPVRAGKVVSDNDNIRVSLDSAAGNPNSLKSKLVDSQDSFDIWGTSEVSSSQNNASSVKVKPSFAAMVNEQPAKKVVKIQEMRNDLKVEGAAVTLPIEAVEAVNARFCNTLYGYFIGSRLAFPLVENYVKNTWAKYGLKRIQLHEEFFLFQFNSREGMENVLENGPWLIRKVPLLLNKWTPDTILKKDEIKRVPVWVKMHHVPIVAYSEIGLSLITTQIGKPIMLDSYTSNMCLHSWGRSTYARALIEISAEDAFKESLVIAIPSSDNEGHSLATIEIEYEWTPPRCSTCKIFDHVNDKCPKLPKVVPNVDVTNDGFTEVKKKKQRNKKNKNKQVEGVRLSKPALNLTYRRVEKGETSKQKEKPCANVEKINSGRSTNMLDTTKVTTTNAFSALSMEDDDKETNVEENQFVNDSDSEVDEYISLEEAVKTDPLKTNNGKGASTPSNDLSS